MTRDMKDALFDHGLVRDVFHCPSGPTFDHYDEIWQEIDKDRYVGDHRQVFNITNYNMLTYQSDYVSNQTKIGYSDSYRSVYDEIQFNTTPDARQVPLVTDMAHLGIDAFGRHLRIANHWNNRGPGLADLHANRGIYPFVNHPDPPPDVQMQLYLDGHVTPVPYRDGIQVRGAFGVGTEW